MGRTIIWAGDVLGSLWFAVGPALCTLAYFFAVLLIVRRVSSCLREEEEVAGRGGSDDEYVWSSTWLRAEHESGLLYAGDVRAWGDEEVAPGEEGSGERRRLAYEDGVSSASDGNYGSVGGEEVERQDLSKGGPGKEEGKEDGRCEECSICLVEYRVGDRVGQLPCGHIFHASCIGEWTRGYFNRCPLCNFDLDLREYPQEK